MPEGFTTPETTAYLLLGLGVIVGFLLVLIGSMVVRYRNLKQDLKTLEQLETES